MHKGLYRLDHFGAQFDAPHGVASNSTHGSQKFRRTARRTQGMCPVPTNVRAEDDWIFMVFGKLSYKSNKVKLTCGGESKE